MQLKHVAATTIALLALFGSHVPARAVCEPQGAVCPNSSYRVFTPCYLDIVGQYVDPQGFRHLDPAGIATIRVVDMTTNAPIPGVPVSLQFQECTDLRIASFQDDAVGEVLTCGPGALSKITSTTNANGDARFHVAGWGNLPACNQPVPTLGIRVQVGDCDFGQILPYKIWDLDGNGLGANDLSVFLNQLGCVRPYFALDYDNDGSLGANDQSIMLGRFGTGTSVVNGPAQCSSSGWTPLTGNVVCNATGAQQNVQVLSDGAEGFYAVWEDLRAGTTSDIYAQRFTRQGSPASGWPVNGLPVCTAANIQSNPVLTTDGAGGFIVAWQDFRSGTNWDIYASRLTPAGAVSPGWAANGNVVANSSADGELLPSLASDGANGAVFAWRVDKPTSDRVVMATRLGPTGLRVAAWPAAGVRLSPAVGFSERPAITRTSGGAFIAAWPWTNGSTARNVNVQKLALANGALLWNSGNPVVAFTANANDQTDAKVVEDASDGAFVMCTRSGTGLNYVPLLQRIGSAGAPSWGAAVSLPNSSSEASAALVADKLGGAIFAEFRAGSGSTPGAIVASRVLASGAVVSGFSNRNVILDYGNVGPFPRSPAIFADGTGGAIFACHMISGTIRKGIVAQRITATGSVASGSWDAQGHLDVMDANGSNAALVQPMLADEGHGGVFIVTADNRNGLASSGQEIYAQMVSPLGVAAPDIDPPSAVTSLSGTVGTTTIAVNWTAPADFGGAAVQSYDLRMSTVQINAGNFDQATSIATGTPQAPGSFECVSLSALNSCQNYWFAIRSQDGNNNRSPISNIPSPKTKCSGVLEVACGSGLTAQLPDPPRAEDMGPALRLSRPDGTGGIRLSVHVHSAQHVRLDVLDVMGRIVMTLRDGDVPAGATTFDWSRQSRRGQEVGPGVYFARLMRPVGTQTVKFVLTQ